MARTVQTTLRTVYDSSGVREGIADVERLRKEMAGMGADVSPSLAKVEKSAESAGNAIEKAGKQAEQSGKRWEKIGSTVKAAGLAIGVGLAAVGAVALKVGVSLVKAGSDVEEMQAKFNTVFAEETPRATKALDELAEAIGRNKYDLRGYASVLQDTFVPLGFARDKATDLSLAVVALAEDLASFNNLNTADVVRDLQSAYVGNTETLKKYGVIANQTAIVEEAIAQGWIESAAELDGYTKALAIHELTLKGTVDAQGDAAKTANSVANQYRAAQSKARALAAELGTKLLPVASELLTSLNEMADDAIPGLVSAAENAIPVITGLANVFFLLAEGAGFVADIVTVTDEETAALDRMTEAQNKFNDAIAGRGFGGAQQNFLFNDFATQMDRFILQSEAGIGAAGLGVLSLEQRTRTFEIAAQMLADGADIAGESLFYMAVAQMRAEEAASALSASQQDAAQATMRNHIAFQDARDSSNAYGKSLRYVNDRSRESIEVYQMIDEAIANNVTTTDEAAEATAAAAKALEDLRQALRAISNAARGSAETDSVFGDLADASGEWRTAVYNDAEEIAEINEQLQAEITEIERAGAEERLGILEERQGQTFRYYTGDIAAVNEANQKITEMRRQLVIDLLREQGNVENSLDLRVALGDISIDEASKIRGQLAFIDAIDNLFGETALDLGAADFILSQEGGADIAAAITEALDKAVQDGFGAEARDAVELAVKLAVDGEIVDRSELDETILAFLENMQSAEGYSVEQVMAITLLPQIDVAAAESAIQQAVDDYSQLGSGDQRLADKLFGKGGEANVLAADLEVYWQGYDDLLTKFSTLEDSIATVAPEGEVHSVTMTDNAGEVIEHLDGVAARVAEIIGPHTLRIDVQYNDPGYTPPDGAGGEQSPPDTPQSNYAGGSVAAGAPYLVGDGPGGQIGAWTELFVPESSGMIVSSSQLQTALNAVGGGQGGIRIGQVILQGGATEDDGRRFVRGVYDELSLAEARFGR